ncbi:hypothetical protein MMMDOFMJ_4305 [Methylobacterium gnaphalii]|nr:hypothetical protein MMMDOFMJ_4305 [Methylobacterium gnaphalii]
MAKPLVYRNTATNLPNWDPSNKLHETCARGYAYESDTHFVHFYGYGPPYWTITCGLTVTEIINGSLIDWCQRIFGAEDIEVGSYEVGTISNKLWRPGLLTDHEVSSFISDSDYNRRLSEQAILSLMQRLDDICFYVEPTAHNMNAYGHKIRDLLILSCTEVENICSSLLRLCGLSKAGSRTTTREYFLLKDLSTMSNWQIKLHRHQDAPLFSPFHGWQGSKPTQSLPWYEAYNKVKHDRTGNFHLATLKCAIESVCACLVLYMSQYGPHKLWDTGSQFSATINDSYSVRLEGLDPKTVYVPEINIPPNQRPDLVCYNSVANIKPRAIST